MASMNWLGFSLSPQELSLQSANQDHSTTAASRLGFNSDGIGVKSGGDCFDLSSDSAAAHSLNLPASSFGIFEAFNRNNNHTPTQDWNNKGLGSNSQEMKMVRENNQKQPKLENLLGRPSFPNQDQATYGNTASAKYMFPNCSLQLPAANAEGATTSSSSIGLSMIKTWLRNQPPPPPQSDSNKKSVGTAENNNRTTQSLSLSMSTGSQSSSALPLITANKEGGESSSSDNKQPKSFTGLDIPSPAIDAVPRKSIDTFGQRTSIYRGVTRHRWTGRYEAHLWDNSCRREGQTRKGRQVYLGGYDKEEKAARAYDLAALKYWGTTTTTNFPISNYEKELEEMKHMTRQEYVASLRRKSSGFSRGASIYRGVTRHHQHGRWQARIGRVAGNKDLYLGTFSTQEEAAEAYDIAAIKFRGLNAVTNFDMSRYDIKSIMESSTLPIGGAAKRLKDVEMNVDGQRTDGDRSNMIISSQITDGGGSWPTLAFHQQPQPYNNSMHYPYGQRIWCKQELDSDAFQLGNSAHHNFFHSGLHNAINMANTIIYAGDDHGNGGAVGYGGRGGYLNVVPTATVIANDLGNHSVNEVKPLGNYETSSVFGYDDPYLARSLHCLDSSPDHVDLVRAGSYDQVSACTTWVPTAVPTLSPIRSANMAFCPLAPPFTLLHE